MTSDGPTDPCLSYPAIFGEEAHKPHGHRYQLVFPAGTPRKQRGSPRPRVTPQSTLPAMRVQSLGLSIQRHHTRL